jgi:AcrR family transcriptional regulator
VRKGALTRQTILEHAVDLATRVGLEGLTIGRLATELELSKSGLFAHFQAKEALQLQVLEAAAARFVDGVVRPALTAPRGEPRLRAVFDRWVGWEQRGAPGGCFFVAAATELDDRPGPVRDRLVQLQKDWLDTIANTVRTGVAEGHFRGDVDPPQFAHDLYGVMLAYHHASRLLRDPRALERARHAFAALLDAIRAEPGRKGA